MVTPDAFDPGNARLEMIVDGKLWQSGLTSDMLFRPDELVSYCSMFLTLQAGDLILTGTPGTSPGAEATLVPGSTMVTRIEGIGEARNLLIADPEVDNSSEWTAGNAPR